MEKITAPDGYGITLSDLVRHNKLGNKHIEALRQFFNECCDKHVAFGEVNAAGIMYCENRSGKPEFVLVDGAGDKLLIPIRSMFRSINATYVRKVEQRICKKLNINYDKTC